MQRGGEAGDAAGEGSGTDPAGCAGQSLDVIPNGRDEAAKWHEVIFMALLNVYKWLS